MFTIGAPKFLKTEPLSDNYLLICNTIFAQLLTHNRCLKLLLYITVTLYKLAIFHAEIQQFLSCKN